MVETVSRVDERVNPLLGKRQAPFGAADASPNGASPARVGTARTSSCVFDVEARPGEPPASQAGLIAVPAADLSAHRKPAHPPTPPHPHTLTPLHFRLTRSA